MSNALFGEKGAMIWGMNGHTGHQLRAGCVNGGREMESAGYELEMILNCK